MPGFSDTADGLPQSPELSRPPIDFSQMTPNELLTLARFSGTAPSNNDLIGQYAFYDSSIEELWDMRRQQVPGLDGELSMYRRSLPGLDIERARQVADSIITSPYAGDREFVEDFFGAFTRVDHESGSRYFERIATDKSSEVRNSLRVAIEDHLRDNETEEALGLSRLEAIGLLRLIEQVDRGELRPQSIGEVALRRLVSLQPRHDSSVEAPASE